MALLVITSCSRDNEEDVLTEQEKKFELQERRGSINNGDSCIITPGMVSNEPSTGAPHTVYASCGGNTKNYDRRVEIYLTQLDDDGNESVIDVANVVIQANQNVSNNSAVQGCGGQVTVKIANVLNLSDATFDNSCSWRQTQGFFPECSPNNGGGEIDFCNGNDEDGDGICDENDPDFGGSGTGFN